ncbi:MAG TPA: HEAT repeat domain-containing protein [Gemmatimonadaceae bacterium]|nr:HEAT repeat domain-containing protein [Gemmatimonadaceae bacterium]
MNVPRKSVGVFTTDRALVVQTWDPWIAHATGIAESTACGVPIAELFPELLERGLLTRLRKVADEGVVELLAPAFHKYLIPCTPLDRTSPFPRMRQHVTLAPLRTGTSIDGVVVTIEDVTPRVQREQELAVDLESHDEEVRLRAAQAMTASTPNASVLGDALADRSWRVRRAAAEGLARASGAQAVDTLIEALREHHRDAAVLNSALTALANSREDVVGAVIGLLGVSDAAVRTYAALALGLLEDARAVHPLLECLNDSDVNVRYHAIEALGRIGDPGAADPLAGIAESRDFFLSFAALDALALIREPSVAPRLLPLLQEPTLRDPAANCLGAIGGEDVVEPLARLLVRAFPAPVPIARTLATIDTRLSTEGASGRVADRVGRAAPEEAPKVLIKALAKAREEDAEAIAVVLGWLKGEGIDEALAGLLAREGIRARVADVLSRRGLPAVEPLLQVVRGGTAEMKQAAAVALGRIGSDRAVHDLTRLLGGEPELAIAAAGALGAIGDRGAFEKLLALLGHPHAMVRQAVVSAINSIGHRDTEWAVASRLADPSPYAREAAVRISGYFGFQTALAPMIDLARDPEEAVRRAAIEHLANFEDVRAADAVHFALEHDPAVSVRCAAVRALGQVETRAAFDALLRACTDPVIWVRYFAVRTIGRRGDEHGVPALLMKLATSDPAPPVRIAAIEALSDPRHASAALELRSLVDDPEPEVARAAILALGRIGSAAEEHLLLQLLELGDHDRITAALESIGRLRLSGTVPRVLAIAREADEFDVRVRAVATLAEIGSPESHQALLSLLRVGRLRAVVADALRRSGAA